MKDIKNVLICGIGAVGSIYADKIQRFSPANLRVLVDENRLERYKKDPLIFNSKQLDFTYVLPQDNNFKADLIIIATKYDGLNDAIKNIENFVQDDTIILSLLNGVTSEEIIAVKYGWDKLLLSYFIGHSAIRTGRNVFHDDVNTIVFGAKNGCSPKVECVKKYFDKVGINYNIPADMEYALWLKYALNVSTNQPSSILGMTFGDMQNNAKFKDFALSIIKEVQAIAKAEGVKGTENFADDAWNAVMSMSSWGKTSMLQDVEAGRKTEVAMFAGTMEQFGKKHNIPTPYNSVLKELVEVIHAQQDLQKQKDPMPV